MELKGEGWGTGGERVGGEKGGEKGGVVLLLRLVPDTGLSCTVSYCVLVTKGSLGH